ncbi:MAG: hypothetical protein ACXVP0_11685, partial [Bacteroidia bacterium]
MTTEWIFVSFYKSDAATYKLRGTIHKIKKPLKPLKTTAKRAFRAYRIFGKLSIFRLLSHSSHLLFHSRHLQFHTENIKDRFYFWRNNTQFK